MFAKSGQCRDMPYLIDGHNLIASLPDIDLADPHDEAKLVNKLRGFVAKTRRKCTVIFDCGIPGGFSPMSNRSVSVIFAAAQHSNADRVLKLHILRTRDPGNWTLVSSDEAVLDKARTYKMKWMTSAEFAEKMQGDQAEDDLAGEEIDVRLTSEEVDEWLDIFGEN